MNKSKKVVLYAFAILIALVLTFDIGLDGIETALLIGFLLILMVLFMVVFMKQLKANELLEEEKKRVSFDVEELIEKESKVCIYCNTVNKKNATYCRKCKHELKDIVCPICGHKNAYNQKYCEKCQSILQNKKVHL